MKKDTWIALIFSFLALLLRIPFMSRFLYHWDSVNYALSLERYDVRLHQPHPPGYFLYSMMGKLLDLVVSDANTSLVIISVVFGSFGIGAIYLLGAKVFDQRTGIFTALLGISSPLHWFESEVALNYSLDFFLVSITALLCIAQWRGQHTLWFWSALLLGITTGVRQVDILFLGPLWLLAIIPLNWKQRISSILVLLVTMLAWLIPMAFLSGGIAGYLEALTASSSGISSESSFFDIKQLTVNLGRFTIYLAYGLGAALLSLVLGVWAMIRSWKTVLKDTRFLPFILWIIPSTLFFVIIHIRQSGHIMLLLPALFVLAGWSISVWMKSAHRQMTGLVIAGIFVVINAFFFLAAPPSLFGSNQVPLQTPSRASIVQRDRFLETRIAAIRETFNPDSTTILAGGLNFRHPDYYLENYQMTSLSYRLSDQPIVLENRVDTLVFFDDQAFPDFSDPRLQTINLLDGSQLRYLRWSPGTRIEISQSTIVFKEQ